MKAMVRVLLEENSLLHARVVKKLIQSGVI